MNRLLLLILFFPTLAFSQLEYKKIVEVDTTSAELLFKRAKSWVTLTSKLHEKVVKLDDLDSGVLILNINFKYKCKLRTNSRTHSGQVSYILELYIKDNNCEYKLFGFKHPTQGLLYDTEEHPGKFNYKSERRYYDSLWKDIMKQTTSEISKISHSLEKALSNPLESE